MKEEPLPLIYTDDYAFAMNGDKQIGYLKLNPSAPDLDIPLLPQWERKEKVLRWVKSRERLPEKEGYYFGKTESGNDSDANKFSKGSLRRLTISEWLEETESASKSYSLEDMEKAINMAKERKEMFDDAPKYSKEQIIQSLSRPKFFTSNLEIIKNNESKKEMIGKYEW